VIAMAAGSIAGSLLAGRKQHCKQQWAAVTARRLAGCLVAAGKQHIKPQGGHQLQQQGHSLVESVVAAGK
jgi:hypothetical protein